MTPEIRNAIMTILGTLPEGMEMRFFWKDGCQHLSMKLDGEPEQLARLNRAPSGIGVVVPATTH